MSNLQNTAHQELESAKLGIRHILALENLPRSPSKADIIEMLNVLEHHMICTEDALDQTLYVNAKEEEPEFDFKREVLAELTELYINDPYKDSQSTKYSLLLKLVAEPILNRLSLLKHNVALALIRPLISSIIDYTEQVEIESNELTIALTQKFLSNV